MSNPTDPTPAVRPAVSGFAAITTPPPFEPPAFLDPHALIESSRPRGNRMAGLPLLAMAVALILVFTAPADSPVGRAIGSIAPVLFLAILVGLNVMGRRGAARLAAEAQAVTALDELVQLRRWSEAGDLAMHLFTRPMLSPERRMHALTSLSSILTRYHRFDDARVVHDYLLQRADDDRPASERANVPPRGPLDPVPDASTAHSIRIARAMGLLREDRLVDADRAMNELRREVNQARDEVRRQAGSDAANKIRSAGLVLLDLYRDIKTYHLEEAVAGFESAKQVLREQLGSRVADAWLLYATALHGLGRAEEAKAAYLNATALVPPLELHRRYPESADLARAYRSWEWPE